MLGINNLTSISVDKGFLKRVVKKVLEGENKKNIELSIALVGQAKIKELNKKYRKKNRAGEEDESSSSRFADARATDVLSFQYASERSERSGEKSQKFLEHNNFGEIVICLREVKKNAKRFDISFKKELIRVLIHGILHVLGYDHEKNKVGAEKMRKKEENYFLAFYVKN